MTDQWIRQFRVAETERHVKGFTMYKVISTIFPRKSPEAKIEVVVWKRYSEFRKLHKELKLRHERLYLKHEFPPFSKPRLFGRFESDVIEERRLAAQALLDFIANQPSLFISQACVKFFEKSHKITSEVLDIDHDHVNACASSSSVTSVPRESDGTAMISQSSSHSSIADTDSTISIESCPSQLEDLCKLASISPTQPDANAAAIVSSPIDLTCNVITAATEAERALFKSTDDKERSTSSTEEEKEKAAGNSSPFPELGALPNSLASNNSMIRASEKDTVLADVCESSDALDTLEDSPCVPDDSGLQGKFKALEVMDYITDAGFHVSQAVEHEANSLFENAFASYKAAISCLLSGVQNDTSEERKSLVQRKASQYLSRAELIYHNHLEANYTATKTIPEATMTPAVQGCVRIPPNNNKSLEAPITDLKAYKVLGIVSTVILALNTCNQTPYIVKVLHKSPCPVDRKTKSIVPCNVPFMCRLFHFIENERAVFLILEQASGGRLWDHISPYFDKYDSQNSAAVFAQFLSCATTGDMLLNANGRTKNESEEATKKVCELPCISSNETSVMKSTKDGERELVGQSKEVLSFPSIPDVVVQRPDPDEAVANLIDIPDKPHTKSIQSSSVEAIRKADTEEILKNSQKLLDSVNNTLLKNEEGKMLFLQTGKLSSHGGSQDEQHAKLHPKVGSNLLSEERISLMSKDHIRSISRDRKSTASRRPRSRIRFSCDDMFEGRARALSRSLDREALQKLDPGLDQSIHPGLPIDLVRLWAAQLLLALDALHRWDVIIGDLRPENLLLGRNLHLVLTYQCKWVCVDRVIHPDAIEQLYAAPEIGNIQAITAAADWWSFGAILFELLSGETLYSCHPGGLHSYSTLYIPNSVSEEGACLLKQLLRFDAQSRLGAGPHGVAKLKAHSFFRDIEWNKVLLMSASV